MGYDLVNHGPQELIGQVKLNQIEENCSVVRAATDVRMAVQLDTDFNFIGSYPGYLPLTYPIAFGAVTLLAPGVFDSTLSALDVPISAVPSGLVSITMGPSLTFRFWKTPDQAYASLWLMAYSKIDTPPATKIRYFNATIMVHRLPRGGY